LRVPSLGGKGAHEARGPAPAAVRCAAKTRLPRPYRRQSQRRHGELMLRLQAQHDPAGDQELQPGCGVQQLGEQRRSLQHRLEVVE